MCCSSISSSTLLDPRPQVLHPLLLLDKDKGPSDCLSCLRSLLPTFTTHPHPGCRLALLGLLHDAWRVRSLGSDPAVDEWRACVRAPLAVLLCDEDPGVRQGAMQHWHEVLARCVRRRMTGRGDSGDTLQCVCVRV